MRRLRPALNAAIALAVALAVAACSSGSTGTAKAVTFTHAAVTPTGTVPGAADGVGTLRLFSAPVSVEGGGSGAFDATMTTTSVDTTAGTETRITKIVFTLNNGADQLILEGTAAYPSAGSTIKTSDTVTRPVIGGSGTYAGAQGSAVSTHLADGTWKHVFNLLP